MSDEQEDPIAVAMGKLLTQVEEHLVTTFPVEDRPPDPDPDSGDDELTAMAVIFAWSFALSACAKERAKALTATDLDDAMLPFGTTDAQLQGDSGGLADGDTVRGVLRSFKAALPADQFLPQAMIDLLATEDIQVR